jgi:hypothetical protein
MSKINGKCIQYFVLWCGLVISCATLQAQDSTNLKGLSDRVGSLERYNKEILEEKFENKSTELTNKIEYELKKAKDDVNDQLWILKITGGVIALLLAAGIGVLLYKYFVGLEKLADRVLKRKLESHLAENSQYIIDVITSQKTENLIKRNKKLLVLCGNDAEKTAAEQLLKAMGFRHVQFLTSTNTENLPAADLIIFSNRNETLPEPLIIEYLEQSGRDDNFIFYGKRLSVDPQSDYADRINFANSRFTLYHQIINTLSFKEIFVNP